MRQLLLIVALAGPASAAPSSMTPDMDRLVMSGVDNIYRMDFDAADAAAKAAMALNPEYPHAYLGDAATDFIRYIYGPQQSDDHLVKEFERKADIAIGVSERWLKTHPNDPDALLVQGSGYGISARLGIERHEYLKAFRHGSRAMKSIRAAIKADPQMYDAYLGLGMFDYYVDTIPRFAGWLAKIMLGGNRERGLKEIRLAAEKGHFARTAAQLILVEVETQDEFGARNPKDAVKLMMGITERYPNSSMLHSALAVALYEDGEYAAGLKESDEYLARVRSGKYAPSNMSMGRSLRGAMLWGLGRKDEALAEFQAGSVETPISRWGVWNRIRAGQLLDSEGRRAAAVTAYRSALDEPDKWGFKAIAKACIAKPCDGPNYPGRFSPN